MRVTYFEEPDSAVIVLREPVSKPERTPERLLWAEKATDTTEETKGGEK